MVNKRLINNENAVRCTLWLIMLAFIGRFCIAKWTGLGIGESYYYGGARILSLSYFDQPPLFMWLSGLLMRVLGESTLVLRLPAIISFAGTSWLLFLITRRFFNAVAGFYAVLFISLSGVFILSGTWFQPDALLMFFWMAYVYCLSQIIFMSKTDLTNAKNKSHVYAWWLLSGIMLGLTILSKYHAIFLVIGLFFFLITSSKSRHWLCHPGIYLSILISLLFALPILVWNYQHQWASFLFQGSRAGDGGSFQLHFDWFLRSIVGQALWLLPWIWVPLILQLFKSFRLRNIDPVYGFCFWLALTPIVFFTVLTLWADLQYHFHWQAPGYMMLFIPLGKMVQDRLEQNFKWQKIMRRWIIWTVSFTIIAISILAFHMQTGFWTWYGPKWVSEHTGGGHYDATMDGYDDTDLMLAFEENGWLDNPYLFVGTTKWWMSGKVDWALKGKKDVVCFDNDARNYAYFVDPNKLLGMDGLIITKGDDPTIENVRPFCDTLQRLPDVEITRSGVTEVNFEVFYCHNFHNSPDARKDLPVTQELNATRW